MASFWQKDSEGDWLETVTCMPFRSLGRFVVYTDRKGQWPIQFGFKLDCRSVGWFRPETAEELEQRLESNEDIRTAKEVIYTAYIAKVEAWEAGGRRGPEPQWEDDLQIEWRGRVERELDAALEEKGMGRLEPGERKMVQVLDLPRLWFVRGHNHRNGCRSVDPGLPF